jgi:hypothetical protein
MAGDYYVNFLLQKLRTKIRQDWPQLLHHDNAQTWTLFTDYKWEALPHLDYSPDMSPPNFDLFVKPKEPPRGQRFQFLETLNAAVNWRIRQLNYKWAIKWYKELQTNMMSRQ